MAEVERNCTAEIENSGALTVLQPTRSAKPTMEGRRVATKLVDVLRRKREGVAD
jgi:hypothetical protein